MDLIIDSDALAAFCARQKGAQFVAVDTEFMRERTYWPILCVVQVAGPEEAVAIDALAEGIDLAPLLALISDPATLKVFHAARQDLEIFFHLSGDLPQRAGRGVAAVSPARPRRPALSRRVARTGGLARDRGAAARPAARPHHARRGGLGNRRACAED